jgi:uncharacterized protein (TIGR00288 family)
MSARQCCRPRVQVNRNAGVRPHKVFMINRSSRHSTRPGSALISRGPQALTPSAQSSPHAPNAALLIDFDNVTMGVRSDLGKELRNLLGSEIVKGKVAVQRAYADWRRYPQYIVPLTESSIDLIFAPAYGSAKKNATDIRLAIDAVELVFARPEIGTFILLSGDSDFSSLVMKLKEYGKYVIGIGIRESSSDLLVQNCDEYYSYNALAGLVKASDEEPSRKWDPWELVVEAVGRMKTNGDVMRSDRLKQVMQDIDAQFDEKNLGMSKFSRFVQDAATRNLLTVTKLENGQLEIAPVAAATPVPAGAAPAAPAPRTATESDEPSRPRRGRRGGRGRGRDREDRPAREATPVTGQPVVSAEPSVAPPAAVAAPAPAPVAVAPTPAPSAPLTPRQPEAAPSAGRDGDRLTRSEAFDLVRRTLTSLVVGEGAVRATTLRARAREVLGRDSESLSERMFVRVLKDAHDAGVIDLRRRGDDFDVAPAAEADSVANQSAKAEAAATPAKPAAPTVRQGMGPRGAMRGGRGGALPPELLSIGVVGVKAPPAVEAAPPAPTVVAEKAKPAKGGAKRAAKTAPDAAPVAKRARAVKAKGRPKKAAAE